MEELIKQALDKYFSDYKQYHLIILILFVVIISIFQILQALWISTRIEKIKNILKKSEIKFSRYNELQVEALRDIYQKLVLFNYANSNLFYNSYDKNNHTQYKNRINVWVKSYLDCINQFSLEKLLLSETIKELVLKTIIDFQQVKNVILNEKEVLEYTEMEGLGDWNIMYEYSDIELEIINRRIENIKTNEFITKSEKHIKELRESIENHFAKMNE